MKKEGFATIHTDGGSRGNPGPASVGYVINNDDWDQPVEVGEKLPAATTNNVAEYTALVRALEHARELGIKNVAVYTDSELMVKQVKGIYRVKNDKLIPLYEDLIAHSKQFDSFHIEHVRRELNKRADELCNLALDGKPITKSGKTVSAAQTQTKKAKPVKQSVHDRAVECLQGVAQTWAKGDPQSPKAEMVWEQLWSILEEEGVLRK